MEIIQGIPSHLSIEGSSVAIGVFDGIHQGHGKIIQSAVSSVKSTGFKSIVLTFDPHPEEVILAKSPPYLTSLNQRIELIRELAIDILIIADFTREISNLKAEEFVSEILIQRLKMKEIWVGYNYAFGKNRTGTIELLKSLSKNYGFKVNVVEPIKIGTEICSSTKIRELLARGKVDKAAALLGRLHKITATVIPGDKRGRMLGYPTANLSWINNSFLPDIGIYAVISTWEGKNYSGIANIGYRPTFRGEELTFEVHIFDFHQEIYNEELTISFVEKIRDEYKFENPEKLKAQIKTDEIYARKILGV